eukprot:ctg_167.g109
MTRSAAAAGGVGIPTKGSVKRVLFVALGAEFTLRLSQYRVVTHRRYDNGSRRLAGRRPPVHLGMQPAPSARVIHFVTGNRKKLEEVEQILQTYTGDNRWSVQPRPLDLPEWQGEPEDIAREKCRAAVRIIRAPTLVEDTQLCFAAWGGLPGPYVKHFVSQVGAAGLVRMLEAFEDKRAVAQCIFALAETPDAEPRLFIGRTAGHVVAPRGHSGFGWDPIFLPDDAACTYAEMGAAAKNAISHRRRALDQLGEYLAQHAAQLPQ